MKFIKSLKNDVLFHLIKLANFSNREDLLQILSAAVACKIKGIGNIAKKVQVKPSDIFKTKIHRWQIGLCNCGRH